MKFNDEILNNLVRKYPAPTFSDRSVRLYEDLIETIVSQQLSIKAADTIFKRFLALFPSSDFPSPDEILSMPDATIRTAGLSFQKISYVKSIASTFLTKQISIEKIEKMTDDQVIEELVKIRGVGKWTAEMILIFTLTRPDIFSIGDLGLRNAITKLYGMTDQKEMLALSEKWKPNRSTACWYLWRSLENKQLD